MFSLNGFMNLREFSLFLARVSSFTVSFLQRVFIKSRKKKKRNEGLILPEADLTVIFQDLIEAVKLSSHRICDAPFLIMILFIINRLSECFYFRPRMWKLIGFCVDIEPAVCFGTSIIFDLHLIREKMSHGQISPVCSARYSETRTHIHWVHLFMLHEKN